MKTNSLMERGVHGTALVKSSVANIVLCGALVFSVNAVTDSKYELDKARENIVKQSQSLKHQSIITNGLVKDQMDLKSKNDKLLNDNATLNQQLKANDEQIAQLQQELEQTELQALGK
jgi:septal ring factor EnvC (AmiA/AmiB activator)